VGSQAPGLEGGGGLAAWEPLGVQAQAQAQTQPSDYWTLDTHIAPTHSTQDQDRGVRRGVRGDAKARAISGSGNGKHMHMMHRHRAMLLLLQGAPKKKKNTTYLPTFFEIF
jgi:hypothetical protein